MFPLIDLHQDLLLHIKERSLFDGNWQTDLSLNTRANVRAVVATAFPYIPGGDFFHSSVNDLIEDYIDKYNEITKEKGSDWKIILNVEDLKGSVLDSGKRGIIISVEGMNKFDGTAEDWNMLNRWHEKGLRSIGMLWNDSNSLGGGALEPGMGLTPLGEEVISWAESKGIIIDLAHMNRKTFRESLSVIKKPAFVSHANSDTLCPSERNCDDDQLKLVAESGGVVGVFCGVKFLETEKQKASIYSVVEHIKYIKNLIGVEHIGIGTDFGGLINGTPKGLSSVADIPDLWKALTEYDFSEKDIELISFGNAFRVFKSHLSSGAV